MIQHNWLIRNLVQLQWGSSSTWDLMSFSSNISEEHSNLQEIWPGWFWTIEQFRIQSGFEWLGLSCNLAYWGGDGLRFSQSHSEEAWTFRWFPSHVPCWLLSFRSGKMIQTQTGWLALEVSEEDVQIIMEEVNICNWVAGSWDSRLHRSSSFKLTWACCWRWQWAGYHWGVWASNVPQLWRVSLIVVYLDLHVIV